MPKIQGIKLFLMKTKAINILILFGLLFWGCDNVLNNSSNIVFPEKNVSFNLHVQPFVKYNCSFSGCHDDYSQAGMRRMTDYFSLFETSNLGLIVPYDTTNGRLLQILTLQNHLTPLKWNFTDNQIKGMKTWIIEGARLN